MRKDAIIGTPITPAALLDQLVGRSFCVSFAARNHGIGDVGQGRQLDRLIQIVGRDGMLLVDNGAFSAWTKGIEIDWREFETWAAAIARVCPQAIIVAPDVIDGSEDENNELLTDFIGGMGMEHDVDIERIMPVWHMHESLRRLEYLAESYQFLAIGSSGEFADPKTKAWAERIREAWSVFDELEATGAYRRPHVHMMRAQQQHTAFDFDSSDSTNVARNHCRYKGQPWHVGAFAARLQSKVSLTSDGIQRIETPAEQAAILDELRNLLKRGFSNA